MLIHAKTNSGSSLFAPQKYEVRRALVHATSLGQPFWCGERLERYWQPMQIEWASNGKLSSLTLQRVLGARGSHDAKPAERVDIKACDRFTVSISGDGDDEVFRGYVGQGSLVIQTGSDYEGASLVAYGPELLLRANAVTGAWYMGLDADQAVTDGSWNAETFVRSGVEASNIPAVFNEAGQPNASPATWNLADETPVGQCAVFVSPGRRIVDDSGLALLDAEYWNAYTALRSVLQWYDCGRVISRDGTDWAGISQLASVPIGEVNITGMNLLDAMRAILIPVGLGFAIEPWAQADGAHRLRVFALHAKASRVGPFLAEPGKSVTMGSAAGRRCSVQRLEFTRDNHKVANDVIVVGARKRMDVVLEFSDVTDCDLQPFWDQSVHDLDDYVSGGIVAWRKWSASTFAAFCEKYSRDVLSGSANAFRSFGWNEDGGLRPTILGTPDLVSIGVTRRPRPVGSWLEADDSSDNVRYMEPMVELGVCGDDESWIRVAADIWADRAGFTLTRNTFYDWYPYAAERCRTLTGSGGQSLFDLYGDMSYLTLLRNAIAVSGAIRLRLRLTGSIESDQCVVGQAAYRSDSSWPIASRKVVFAPNRFASHMDLSGQIADNGLGDAEQYAFHVRDVLEEATGHGSIMLRRIDRSYRIGDAIGFTGGRKVSLSVSGRGIEDAESYAPVVVSVVWNLGDGVAKTELVLESPLLQVNR